MQLTITVKEAPLGSHQMLGKQYCFGEEGFSFGRSAEADLVLPDANKYVSSRHGMVSFENGAFSVHDQSSNGLFMDEQSEPLGRGQPVALRNGSTLKAGEYQLAVSIEEGSVDPAPAETRPELKVVSEAAPANAGQRPTETMPSQKQSSPEDLALELAMRLGVHGMTEDKLRQMPDSVTHVIRSCVEGIMDVLSSRRQVKNQLKMDMTVIQGARNNALKFSASADEAIERMFSNNSEQYLPPETALLEAFHDIADHQIAMMAASIQVHQQVVERFDPEALENQLKEQAKGRKLFSGGPDLWEQYKKQYQDIACEGYASIHDEFVAEFSEAYSEHLRKLRQERDRSES